ncbi:MAG: ABC transporter substrate-binding protein [Clostridiales Family XIII bacterium]|jgi:iron complex transport system substrate-binding protein|nr:ABC transporter substrate-binding protein [Clostridiales Family XIII bacterium]
MNGFSRKNKILAALLIALVVLLPAPLAGCAGNAASAEAAQENETQIFTDSAGRSVELPRTIDRVAPSGAYAQILLYSLCPEKLIGLSAPFSKNQKRYIDEKYWDLPVFGQFYGKNATMNFEEIIKAAPDVIIDVGEEKDGIAADMDGIQEQTGIPVLFVKATLDTTAEAYEALGALLGVPERGAALSAYVRETLAYAAENRARIAEEDRVGVLFGNGEYGLEVAGAGSVHAETLEVAGAVNVAVLDKVSGSGRDAVSIEQVLLWDPDAVILAPDSCYGDIFDDPLWAGVGAVQRGAVYEIPSGPYSWLDRPPSVQRALGVLWLGNLLYPELYDIDMIEETRRFYALFWNHALTEDEARALLENSTLRNYRPDTSIKTTQTPR